MGKRGMGRAVNKWWQKWAKTNRGSRPEKKDLRDTMIIRI
jgi:hypothetical protein